MTIPTDCRTLLDAAIAAVPADLAVHLIAAVDATALIEACDTIAHCPRAHVATWWDDIAALDAAACYSVRESGTLPTWWDGGYDDAADRHAETLPAEEVEEDRTCWRCTGCGEGATPESNCPVCHGRGVLAREVDL